MITQEPRPPLLRRSADDRLLAGVCGGLAEHLGFPAMWVRIVMVALVLAGGAGVVFYLWIWGTVPLGEATSRVAPMRSALTPQAKAPARAQPPAPASAPAAGAPRPAAPSSREHAPATTASLAPTVSHAPGAAAPSPGTPVAAGPAATAATAAPASLASSAPTTHAPEPDEPRARRRWPIAELLFGVCLLFVGLLLVLQRTGFEINLDVILPGLAVLVGVGMTWWQIADRKHPDRNPLPRVLGALALVAVGMLMFFVTSNALNAWTVIGASLAVLAGVALAIAPWVLRINRELIAERAGREREAERSEIAAHLHDSVLQTLALIQQRSEPGSEVSRIARGQERELREWLFRDADGGVGAARDTVLAELRAHAAALEADHAVRFETVGVGAEVVVPEPIVAAAKEAMLNAARHAGGEVSVYAEVTPARVAIDIMDRGPGLNPAELPEGRLGVRESILGRMARAGGTARIAPGPGGQGTAVRLAMPREAVPDPHPDSPTTQSPEPRNTERPS